MTLRCNPECGKGYDIVVEAGSLDRIGALLDLSGRKVLVVTDDGVPSEYAEKVAAAFAGSRILTLKAGESTKSISALEDIFSTLVEQRFSRNDVIVAVGGGMVGDLCGFAAACYMRGIAFYSVPTTLLSQVDSSIGGKTAINFRGVKNIVGAFHNPSGVIVDPECLDTLPPRIFAEGIAEMIKMAATSDETLFERICSWEGDRTELCGMIAGALGIKLNVVQSDPYEKGLRKVLNFGHTIGHAIESAAGGTLYHGECVAAGMMYMSEGSARQRIAAALEKYGLPLSDDFDTDRLCELAGHDKKAGASGVTAVWVSGIGRFEFREFTQEELRQLIIKRKYEQQHR
mgnify:CR=1 FL=1